MSNIFSYLSSLLNKIRFNTSPPNETVIVPRVKANNTDQFKSVEIPKDWSSVCGGDRFVSPIRKYIKLFPYILLVIILYKKKRLLIDFPKLKNDLLKIVSDLKSGKLDKKLLLKFGINSSKVRSKLSSAYTGPVEDILGLVVITEARYSRFYGECLLITLVDPITDDEVSETFLTFNNEYDGFFEKVFEKIRTQYLDDSVYSGYLVTGKSRRDLKTDIIVNVGKTYEIFKMLREFKNGFFIYKGISKSLIGELESRSKRLFKVEAKYTDLSSDRKDYCSFRKISVIEEIGVNNFLDKYHLGKVEVTDYFPFEALEN